MPDNANGTIWGAVAILTWGGLGALGAMSAGLPPHLVLGACFLIAAALGWAICLLRGVRPSSLLARETIISAALLAGYHLTYFEAFHHAAAIPVSIINYLWPACLIVIGNIFFRLNSGAAGYFGALIGFVGIVVLIGGDSFTIRPEEAVGYGLAFLGAVLWATYSNLRRGALFEGMGAMVSICLVAAAICSAIAFLAGESMPALTPRDFLVILLLGVGPAGGAFFMWDYGMRRGNAALLGVMAYAAPVLSTVLMVLLGMGAPTWRMAVAVVLITLSGLIVQVGSSRRRVIARP